MNYEFCSNGQRISVEASPEHGIRSARFDLPSFYLAICALDFERHPAVRIDPLHLFYRSPQGDGLRTVIFRAECVMCHDRRSKGHEQTTHPADHNRQSFSHLDCPPDCSTVRLLTSRAAPVSIPGSRSKRPPSSCNYLHDRQTRKDLLGADSWDRPPSREERSSRVACTSSGPRP